MESPSCIVATSVGSRASEGAALQKLEQNVQSCQEGRHGSIASMGPRCCRSAQEVKCTAWERSIILLAFNSICSQILLLERPCLAMTDCLASVLGSGILQDGSTLMLVLLPRSLEEEMQTGVNVRVTPSLLTWGPAGFCRGVAEVRHDTGEVLHCCLTGTGFEVDVEVPPGPIRAPSSFIRNQSQGSFKCVHGPRPAGPWTQITLRVTAPA